MRIGILKDRNGTLSDFHKRFIAIAEFNHIEISILDHEDSSFWDHLKKVDLFIYRWVQFDDHHQIAETILPIIENVLKIQCLPNGATCWHYDDKIKEYYLSRQSDLPMIESWIFWSKHKALEWLETAQLPVVFKLKGGAGSSNVILIKNKETGSKLVNRMFSTGIRSARIPDKGRVQWSDFNLGKAFYNQGKIFWKYLNNKDITPYWQIHKNYVLFQKYLPNNEYDTRVTTVGNRAFAFRRMNRAGDFRSSGSGRIDYSIENIDLDIVKVALAISKKMEFQSMAYDFLYDEDRKFWFCEMSYTFVDTAIKNCPGYWDENLQWHEGHFWPQYFMLIDAFNNTTLEQPEL